MRRSHVASRLGAGFDQALAFQQPISFQYSRHADPPYYNQHWGLGPNFEAEVATELSEFLRRFDSTHDGFWTAVLYGNVVGAIAIDGSTSDEGTRLRWFVVSPECQGCGLGQLLMSKAINFCRNSSFSQVYLWTFAGLIAARQIYEQFGFVLDEEYVDSQWGNSVTHQKLRLNLLSASNCNLYL